MILRREVPRTRRLLWKPTHTRADKCIEKTSNIGYRCSPNGYKCSQQTILSCYSPKTQEGHLWCFMLLMVRSRTSRHIMARIKLGGFTRAALCQKLTREDCFRHGMESRVTDRPYSWDTPWRPCHNGGGTHWPGKLSRNSPQVDSSSSSS